MLPSLAQCFNIHSPRHHLGLLAAGWLLAALLATSASAASAAAAAPYYNARSEVQQFIDDMQQRGFERTSLENAFAQTQPIAAVIRAVMPAKNPGRRSWQAYRQRFIEHKRIQWGLEFWQSHATELTAASRSSGVPAEFIVAIIGIESIYGRHTGNFQTFAALSTLAFDYPPINPATDAQRARLFRGELVALLELARNEQRDPLAYRGSYAGALGLPQFLPSSVQHYAVDGNGDGHIDLEESPADAIFSVANFLKQHGWQSGQPIMAELAGIDRQNPARIDPLIEAGILPHALPSQMTDHGVQLLPATPELPAALIDLETPGAATEYRLGYQNFYVITRYNRSSFYAMTVHDLAQVLRSRRDETLQAGCPATDNRPC